MNQQWWNDYCRSAVGAQRSAYGSIVGGLYGNPLGAMNAYAPGERITGQAMANYQQALAWGETYLARDPFCAYCGQRNSKAKCENCGAPMVNP